MSASTLLGWWLGLVSTSAASPLTPDALVRAALDRDLQVVAARAELTEARGALAQERGPRANPTVSGAASLSSDLIDLDLSQPLSPLQGLALARAAEAEVHAAELRLQRARLEAAANARALLAEAIAAEEVARLSEATLAEATRRRMLAEQRTAAGEQSLLEARLARLEQASAAEAAVRARREANQARVRLAALLPEGTEIELPDDPLVVVPATARGASDRLDLAAASAELEAAQARLDAARASALPGFELGAFAERDGGQWDAGPSLSLTVPIWHRDPADRAMAAGDHAVAEAALAQTAAVAGAERALTEEARDTADQTLAAVGAELSEDPAAALADLDAAVAAGELDSSTAALLRAQIRAGAAAALALRLEVAHAHLDALLANDDPALLEGSEVTP